MHQDERAPVDQRMPALAADLVSDHAELDFSMGALKTLDGLVAANGKGAPRAQVERWGAYFGETLRRSAPNEARWLSYEAAAAEAKGVAAMGRGPDIEAVLRIRDRYFFPIAKVEKRILNGASDSLHAFGPVALALALPAEKARPPVTSRDQVSAEGLAMFEPFFSDPTLENLDLLSRSVTHINRRAQRFLLAEKAPNPQIFWPLLGVKASGRGWSRKNPGRTAAGWLWYAWEAGAVDREEVLRDAQSRLSAKDKVERSNAGFLVGRILLAGGDGAFGQAYQGADQVVRLALLEALSSHVRGLIMDTRPGGRRTAVLGDQDEHLVILRAALKGPPAFRAEALDLAAQMTGKLRLPIAPLVEPLCEVMESAKPGPVETAIRAVKGQVTAVRRGQDAWSAPLDRAVSLFARHVKPIPGKTKTTKVQIAAAWALRAVEKESEHVPQAARRAAAEALERYGSIR